MMYKHIVFGMIAFLLTACVQTTNSPQAPRILAMGDSMMAAHKISNRAVADAVSRNLNEPVIDRSVVGASMLYALPITGAMGLRIPSQYRGGAYDWVVLNGGGNDLWLGCGCDGCTRKMNRLITADGAHGEIPNLVARIRASGARVIWLGYLRTPGVTSPIEGCGDEGHELESRLARMAARDAGVHFLSNAELVPYGDKSFHGLDLIHPSKKGSFAIGQRVSAYIRKVDRTR
jgi:lysophospholipase L1-like esterase